MVSDACYVYGAFILLSKTILPSTCLNVQNMNPSHVSYKHPKFVLLVVCYCFSDLKLLCVLLLRLNCFV